MKEGNAQGLQRKNVAIVDGTLRRTEDAKKLPWHEGIED